MSNGVLCFANNNGKVDYLKQAIFLAERVKQYLDLPISLVTANKKDFDYMYSDKRDLFDNIIEAEPQEYKDSNFDLKVLRQDVDKFIDADEDIIKSRQKIEYLKQICGYCESTLKQINNRTFQIKNAIEWKKFTMGSM